MKKILSFILIFVFIIGLCSCGNQNNVTTTQNKNINNQSFDYLDLILQLKEDYLGVEEELNDKNIISDAPTHFIDNNVKETLVVKINGVDEELHYSESLYYQVGDQTLHLYLVNGEEGKTVLIDKNQKISSLLYKFTVINVNESATPEEVLLELKDILSEYLDLSSYKYIKMPEDKSKENDGFGSYRFIFYNSVGGYQTDWIKISVSDDGAVFGFAINNLKHNISSLNINEDLANEMLELKFKDMFTTEKTEYISYKVDETYPRRVIVINDKSYIEYRGSARYLHKDSGLEVNSYSQYIYIPVEIISSK